MRPLLLVFLACASATSQPAVSELLESKTLAELKHFDESFTGVLGVAAIDLTSGRSFAYDGDTLFAQASVIKIPILARMFQAERAGQFRFSDKVTINPKEAVGGSGYLQDDLKKGPVTLTIQELITKMIEDSDNTATNKCIDMVGMEQVNRMLDELGFPKTRLQRKMMDAEAAAHDRENISTPNEMARLVERIYRGKVVDEKACRDILAIMRKVRGGIAQGLPLDTETAVKTGELPGARAETGVVFLPGRPFVVSIMSAYIDDRRTPVAEVTRILYRYFEPLARSNAYGRAIK